MNITLNEAQIAEIRRMKQYFPYRIVYGVINKDTGEWHVDAATTKARMNNLLRKGHFVFTIDSKELK